METPPLSFSKKWEKLEKIAPPLFSLRESGKSVRKGYFAVASAPNSTAVSLAPRHCSLFREQNTASSAKMQCFVTRKNGC